MLTAKEALALSKASLPMYEAEMLSKILSQIEGVAKRFGATSLEVSIKNVTPGVKSKLLKLGYLVGDNGYSDIVTIYWEDA